MSKITVWHNPRCGKSREALKTLEELGVESEVFKYLDEKPTVEELKALLKTLGFASAREWMRTKEVLYKELNLKNETDEEKLLEAMAENPKLIERPVVIKGNRAIVARPSSLISEFLKT